jgi:hypothetical protein
MCARGDDPTPERDRSEKGAACRAMTVQVASASKKGCATGEKPRLEKHTKRATCRRVPSWIAKEISKTRVRGCGSAVVFTTVLNRLRRAKTDAK